MENKRIYGLVNMNVPVRNIATALGVALLGAACGQTEVSQSSTGPSRAVQGEPIQGEPILGAPIDGAVVESLSTPEGSESIVEDAEVTESVPMVPLVAANPIEPDTAIEADQSVQEEASELIGAAEAIKEAVNEAIDGTMETVDLVAEEPVSSVSEVAEAAEVTELEVLALDESEGIAKDVHGAPEKLADGSLDISFDRLASFEYEMPEDLTEEVVGETDGASNQIPEDIRRLNDQPIALKGFMLPLKVEEGLVTEMLIMRDQSMCCYGTVPKINEWVSVRMEGKGVKPVMDEAVTLFGKLKVGEIRENGYLVGIYEMDGDRMDGPTDL